MAGLSYLAGKVAIVTGAGSGIGKVIAHSFAKAGASVVVAEMNEQNGEQTAKELLQAKHRAHFVKTNVTDSESVRKMVAETVSTFGKLDIAINNAAVPPDSRKISDLDEKEWSKRIDTNLSGVAFSLKWQLQQMIRQGNGGSIVNMSSITAIRPVAQLPAYSTAKQGVVTLTKIAALENGCHGIRVNAIAPGATRTQMLTDALKLMNLEEDAYAAEAYLLKRVATPEEIADAAGWLASDQCSYITGVTVPVDGGFSIM
ncbi:SDR family oxidoreductase [Penicillium taxi]|uniref:SDR family oxidoreductase n=1 Tax=Penicillium taxi TaxID=168475 RepID=UPI002544F9ED|nr:SDR family oxidoreductase [Penicillium taxi]KAJ5902902.1 SDR family oxidoreductase [Penicillium taxi]